VTVTLGHPTDRRPPFKFAAHTRVGFSDTDAQGIVYYGRYLPYFDFARTEYLRHLALLSLTLEGGHEFVMRALSVVYEAPASFDDLLEVFVRTKRIGRSSVTNEFCAVHEDGTLMCTSEQTLVRVDLAERRPVPVPEVFREALAAFEGADLDAAVAR
jgi:acyl-CoA thioester hydrolase